MSGTNGTATSEGARERLVICHRHVPKSLQSPIAGEGDPEALFAAHVWSRTVAGRLRAAGGELHAHVSGTVIASFDPGELADVIEVSLDLLDEADDAGIAIGLGVSVGVLHAGVGGAADGERASEYGLPLERAQVLASRVPAGEIALDAEARARSRGLLLFAKQISPGHGIRGYLVDRTHPRRDASALAMKRLGEPVLPPVTRALLPVLRDLVSRPTGAMPLIVLRGPPGAGAIEVLEATRRELGVRSQLYLVGASPAAAVPLGSLRALLAQHDLAESALRGHRAVLQLVMDGTLPSRDSLAEALGACLPDPAWIFLAPLVEVDPATLAVIAQLRALRPRTVVIGRYGLDLPVPSELSGPGIVELTLPALRTSDARVVAESLLGEGVDPEVIRRVAVLGGETSLGVVEAARTLIACGELVLDGDAFAFRPGAGMGRSSRRAAAVSLDLLIAERAEMLDDESRKCLEAISILSEPVPIVELEAVLLLDGVPSRSVPRALSRLDDDGWIERQIPLGSSSAGANGTVRCANVHVRHLLSAGLHPARRAELHRFAYAALEGRRDGASGQAELGIHECEAGREGPGAIRLLEAAEGALAAGYGRAAARLARLVKRSAVDPRILAGAADVLERGEGGVPDLDLSEHDARPSAPPSDEASLDATASAEPLEAKVRRVRDETTESLEMDLVAEVTDAIRERDAERLELIARRAVLDGLEMSHVARLRALADLLRGDVGGAARGLVKARSLRPAAPVGRRALLTEAMVSLRAGAATSAVRLALRALAEARTDGDARGESVALFTMAAGYRALGRDEDASRLEQRAQVAGS